MCPGLDKSTKTATSAPLWCRSVERAICSFTIMASHPGTTSIVGRRWQRHFHDIFSFQAASRGQYDQASQAVGVSIGLCGGGGLSWSVHSSRELLRVV